MGFQTDIVIADLAEAQALADAESTTGRDGFTFNGFDRVQLCTLLSLVDSGSGDSQFDRYLDSIDVVPSSSDEWPVVSVVKPEQVAELATVAKLDDTEFDRLAASWAATEEFEGWVRTDVRDLLRELSDLADTAALQRKCVMLWESP